MAETCKNGAGSSCPSRCLLGTSSILNILYVSPHSAHVDMPRGAGPWLPRKRTSARIQTKFMSRRLQTLPLCSMLSSVQGLLYPFKCVIHTSGLVQDTGLWETDSRHRWVFGIWKMAHRCRAADCAAPHADFECGL